MSFFRRKLSKNAPASPKFGTTAVSCPGSPATGGRDTHHDIYNSSGRPAVGSPGIGGARPKQLLLRTEDVMAIKGLKVQTPVQTSSRLSKTFLEVVNDTNALQCLLQYLTSQRAGHLLQFWLDANSFQASTWSRLHAQSAHTEQLNSDRPGDSQGQGQGQSVDVNQDLCQGQSSQDLVQYSTRCDSSARTTGSAVLPSGECVSQCDAGSQVTVSRTNSGNIPIDKYSLTQSSQPPCDVRTVEKQISQCDTNPAETPGVSSANQTNSNSSAAALNNSSTSAESSSSPSHSGKQIHLSSSSHTDAHTNTPAVSMEMSPDHVGTAATNSIPMRKESLQDRLKKSIERDAVKVYAQYISKDAIHQIGMSDQLRNATISKICREDGQVDPECFVPCQEFVLEVINTEHYKDFIQSEFYLQHQVHVLTKSQVNLADILYNESAIVYFMEYMEQEKAMPLLQCWLELDSFQQHLASQDGQYDPQQAQNDAMVIYEKYFSLQATHPLGFDDTVRFEVEGNICREEGPLPDCFHKPKHIVLRTIDKVYFKYYLQNDLYFKYLSDLVSTVQTAQDLPPLRRKRTESDASSEKSFGSHSTGSENISSKNTLLATDTSGYRIKKALTKINDDMRIDSELFNPDSLWKREATRGLSLGKMDFMGQFISEFDPEPDKDKKKKGGFFKKNKEKEKAQEQMAMQVAQMIISDITGGSTSAQSDVALGNETGTDPFS